MKKTIQKALRELSKALDGQNATYFESVKRRAYRAINSGSKLQMDAVRIEIEARLRTAKRDHVLHAILKAAYTLFQLLFEESHA